jgi:hypothetical protein
MSQPLPEASVEAVAADLAHFLESPAVSAIGPKEFKVVSALDPEKAGDGLRRFSTKHGQASFKAGGKLE